VNRETAELVAHDLALTSVKSSADPDAESVNGIADGARAADGAGGTVERGKEPIAHGIKLPAAEASEFAADGGVVGLEKVPPGTIPDRRGGRSGAHDVGEENGREHPIGLGTPSDAGEELLDLVE
jgi:hypothetical protein